MLRGLAGRWKQPIFYYFDMAKVQRILLKLIEKNEAAGFPVEAIVHDLAPTNLRVWKELGIDPFKTVSLKDPCETIDVFLF